MPSFECLEFRDFGGFPKLGTFRTNEHRSVHTQSPAAKQSESIKETAINYAWRNGRAFTLIFGVLFARSNQPLFGEVVIREGVLHRERNSSGAIVITSFGRFPRQGGRNAAFHEAVGAAPGLIPVMPKPAAEMIEQPCLEFGVFIGCDAKAEVLPPAAQNGI